MSRILTILALLLVTFLGQTVASDHGIDWLAETMVIAFLLTMAIGMSYFTMKAVFALSRLSKR